MTDTQQKTEDIMISYVDAPYRKVCNDQPGSDVAIYIKSW